MALIRLPFKLTLLGRSLLLLVLEISANAICWSVAGILFGRNKDTRPVLSLALLAWTLGLRHALDADHISTIVVVVTVAIAISSSVFDKLHRVSDVGGVVGAAVSGSFLFIVGLANTVILWRIIKQRRKAAIRRKRLADGEAVVDTDDKPQYSHMIMMRIVGPIITFVNRPWKMYPVGVLFGFGFDTASSIALLALSAIAKRGSDGNAIPPSHIVVLPLLFTAGMTMIDSVDSILMLYSYSGFPEHSWALIERRQKPSPNTDAEKVHDTSEKQEEDAKGPAVHEKASKDAQDIDVSQPDAKITRDTAVKMNVMSGLSIMLTLMSILVAFSISLITIMGLIGEQCGKCVAAAEAEDGGGLAGSWWRAWAKANDNSGYIGAAIVGVFIIVVAGWYGTRWVARKAAVRKQQQSGA
ncbi:High-affinity nickel transport protein [Hypsizygus marmoreus]|uniref:Nickel/cobalt efflux system n=1 Tax=Hypsizygus marmoreus TaxID=39966 RepID=A0A369JC95_HYPMA|nr:High-affinity nickel transport protein [Hypsizygus marmoreus]